MVQAPSSRGVGIKVLASAEILAGGAILYWAFAYGIHDESSLGTVFFFWGSLAALLGLLVPGLLLFFRAQTWWGCQLASALVVAGVIALLVAGQCAGR